MKKWLKIWMLTMAFVAAMTAVVSTGKVEAQSTANNEVQVVIGKYNDWVNTCSWGNFLFNFNASVDEQHDSTWNVFECKFGESSQKAITLQLSWDLTSTSGWFIISWENVKLSNTVWTKNPDGLWTNTAITSWYATDYNTLFNKNAKTIWDASWSVTIDITVPAWQPDGTYQGTLVLTF